MDLEFCSAIVGSFEKEYVLSPSSVSKKKSPLKRKLLIRSPSKVKIYKSPVGRTEKWIKLIIPGLTREFVASQIAEEVNDGMNSDISSQVSCDEVLYTLTAVDHHMPAPGWSFETWTVSADFQRGLTSAVKNTVSAKVIENVDGCLTTRTSCDLCDLSAAQGVRCKHAIAALLLVVDDKAIEEVEVRRRQAKALAYREKMVASKENLGSKGILNFMDRVASAFKSKSPSPLKPNSPLKSNSLSKPSPHKLKASPLKLNSPNSPLKPDSPFKLYSKSPLRNNKSPAKSLPLRCSIESPVQGSLCEQICDTNALSKIGEVVFDPLQTGDKVECSLQEEGERLRAIIDAMDKERLVFYLHNMISDTDGILLLRKVFHTKSS